MHTGLPELMIILLTSALLLMPIALAAWMIVTLSRIRATQKNLQDKLDTMTHSLQGSAERQDPAQQDAGSIPEAPTSGSVCVWCGKPVTEDEAFWLRAGARLCPSCAADAGRIAADQRLGRGPQPPPADR